MSISGVALEFASRKPKDLQDLTKILGCLGNGQIPGDPGELWDALGQPWEALGSPGMPQDSCGKPWGTLGQGSCACPYEHVTSVPAQKAYLTSSLMQLLTVSQKGIFPACQGAANNIVLQQSVHPIYQLYISPNPSSFKVQVFSPWIRWLLDGSKPLRP